MKFSLVRGSGLSSRVIAWFGAGGYSHIDVVNDRGEELLLRGARSDVIDDFPAGCCDRPWAYEKWARWTIFDLDFTPEQRRRYWEYSDAQQGKPYDSRGLFNSFLFGRRWRDDNAWWCSELVAACLEYSGRIGRLANNVTSVEPGDCGFILSGAGATWRDIRARR